MEIRDDPSSDFGLPFKVIIDGRDRTAVWWLSDKTEPAESFAKRLIDVEALTQEMQAVKKAEELKTQFEYKGHQVEILGDPNAPMLITVDGKDRMVFWNPDNPNCAATQVKGHLDAQLRSKLEFKIRDLSDKASTAEAKKAEEKERIKALEAKIGITLDELKRLPAPVRAKLDESIAEKLKASYAAEEAQKVAKVKAAEADRVIMEARANEAANEAGKKMASIFEERKKPASIAIPNQKPSTAYTAADAAYEASRKQNAMWKAWERRNRISKAVRIVIANILAVPAYMLLHRIGLDWASWTVAIVVMVYSMIILVSPGTPDAWRAHLEKWK